MERDVMLWIRRSLAGDEDAFAEIFHAYKNLVFKTAFLLLDSAEEAEDALQEVFINAHRALASYDPAKGAFTTWLYRLTTNHCLSRRRRRRFLLLPFEDVHPALEDTGASAQHADAEDNDEVWRAMRALSDKLRAVLVLRYYGELSYAEIALALDIPIGTVKSRLNQALHVLRDELHAAEPMPTLRAMEAAR